MLRAGTGVIERIGLKPERAEFLIQSSPPACADEAATARRRPDWIRRKISLCDLCASAMKPAKAQGRRIRMMIFDQGSLAHGALNLKWLWYKFSVEGPEYPPLVERDECDFYCSSGDIPA